MSDLCSPASLGVGLTALPRDWTRVGSAIYGVIVFLYQFFCLS
jgi:hypothetical protein